MDIDPGFLFHQYKKKKLNKLILDIERSNDDDSTKKVIPVLRKYMEVAERFEDRMGDDNDAGNLSIEAMRGLLEQAEREAEEES